MYIYADKLKSPLLGNALTHLLPFAFDERWRITNSIDEADIVPILLQFGPPKQARDQYNYYQSITTRKHKIVMLDLFHDREDPDSHRYDGYYKIWGDDLVILTTYYDHYDPRLVTYDFLWNRTKGLYSYGYFNTKIAQESNWFRGLDLDIFQGGSIYKKNFTGKIICPNRVYEGKLETVNRLWYRKQLQQDVEDFENVLISDPDNFKIFKTANWKPEYKDTINNGGVYAPIDPLIYKSTFASAYVESVCVDTINKSITEKTWEPLLKGHFIIPFAAPGIIDELLSRGFIMPEFIDYSYANEQDDKLRYQGFIEEIQKLNSLPFNKINKLYKDNLEILVYNQNQFKLKEYDDLYSKLTP